MNREIADIRNEYSKATLDIKETAENPIDQFRKWFQEAVNAQVPEPSAMVISTASPEGRPSSRVMLLKDVSDQGFIFFTNYKSRKGQELEKNPFASFTFFWPELERQVRIEGKLTKTEASKSDAYFKTRPRGSQIGAWASAQSEELPDRSMLELRERDLMERYEGKEIPRPDHWGGYELLPDKIEFWQGRPSRLHDRIVYTLDNGNWKRKRISP